MTYMVPEEDAVRLRAEVRRLAESHDMVVRWNHELEAERDHYRAALQRIYQAGRGPHVELARDALNMPPSERQGS